MNVLFLFDCVSLTALAPHSFESLGIDHAVFSQQTNQRSHQRTIEVSVLRVTQKQIETALQTFS